jgi:recombination protein RecA
VPAIGEIATNSATSNDAKSPHGGAPISTVLVIAPTDSSAIDQSSIDHAVGSIEVARRGQLQVLLVNENKTCTVNFIGNNDVSRLNAHGRCGIRSTQTMSATALRVIEGQSMDKSKALDAALSQIERAFGKGSIMRLGKNENPVEVGTVATGSLGLDIALGIGGLPRGRIVEIYGPESSGKTTMALHTVAEAQRAGGICGFIDAEHALDASYARKLGVNLDDLLISQPDTGEQALEIADTLVRSGAIDVLVVDSVAALTPRAEIEGEMGDQLPGLQARLMSQALRKLTASINRSQTMVIFINQIRMKIGVMFGSPETTTGGNALKFYSSVRLDIRRIGSIKERDEVIGNQTRVKVVKNKLAPPFKQVEFDIMYGEGISKTGELIDLGVKAGIVEKSGAWFSYDSQRLGQGRENAKTFLRDNPEIADAIERAIRQNAGFIAEKFLERGDETAAGDDDALEA